MKSIDNHPDYYRQTIKDYQKTLKKNINTPKNYKYLINKPPT